jgi:hypothetical protein
MAKADTTKITVDYLGLTHGQDVKAWREILDSQGLSSLVRWGASNQVVLYVSLIELAGSAVAICVSVLSLSLVAVAAVKPKAVLAVTGPYAMSLLWSGGAMLAAVLASTVVVDRAQARLRHPAEAAMLLFSGLAIVQFRRLSQSKANAGQRADPLPEGL